MKGFSLFHSFVYLKNLTILGFKSFADKTSLDFPPGITAIVGPNGCGKSNVADSIRWVLGEQSAKALRGGEMTDIIFNGTETRRPLSMAEVSLTICDVDQEQLRAANLEVLFNEVTVTRRIFRDGTSEYFLNKTPCRLKDIQQLFLGTGVGRTSYSIMAQGHITQILSSRPEDRRMIFEEAAGITRFKAQKKEALRKLDQTEINLGKITETIREMKRQIGSLQRQAGKARRYKTLAEDLRFLETHYYYHLYHHTSDELQSSREEARKFEEQIGLNQQDIQSLEERIHQSRQEEKEIEETLGSRQQQSRETRAQVDSLRERMEFNRERIEENTLRLGTASGEIQSALEKKLSAEQESQEIELSLQSARQELENARQLRQQRAEALQTLEASLSARQSALRTLQNQLLGISQKLSRLRSQINTLDIQKQGNRVRLEKLQSEIAQNQEETTKLEAKIQDFNQVAQSDKEIGEEKRGRLQKLQSELSAFQSENSTLSQQQEELFRQIATRKSRLNVLEQLQSSREGFAAGAAALLKEKAQGVLGALVDQIRIPAPYVNPVEALLGTHLQLVLSEKPESAQSILDHLKNAKKGTASIAPLDWGEVADAAGNSGETPTPDFSKVGEGEELSSQPPVRVLDIVEADESVLPLLKRLLGHAWIVPGLAQAARLWSLNPGRCEFVTHTCEILTQNGVFIGGSRKEIPVSSSILGRKNEIADLKKAIDKGETDIQQIKTARQKLLDQQKASQENLIRIQSEIRSHEMAAATRLGEYRALENALRIHKQQAETLSREGALLSGREEESSTQRQILVTQIEEAEQEERTNSESISELNGTLDQQREERDAAHNALTEVKIALASKEQFSNTLALQKNSLQNRMAELNRLVETRKKEMDELNRKIGVSQSEIEESKLKVQFLSTELEEINRRITDLLVQKKATQEVIEEREAALKNLRQQLQQTEKQLQNLNIQIAQRQMTLDNITARMRERYQLEILMLVPEPFLVEENGEGVQIFRQGEPKTENAEAPAPGTETQSPAPAAPDWEHVFSLVQKLQERIDQMGPVNMIAIEEYEELEQRFNFMTAQQEDMVKAKAQLLDIVGKINQQTREMFLETFEKIRMNFRSMFTTFFQGGYAELSLVDERDVLESGIEIEARPPGKQLKSVSLLSGGEQTMTAVALLFAIYQVRPSPFCVLDELDAPLDEANVSRFVEVLKQFLDSSQFVVITHSKQTIACANCIHGVTMPERGITKMISMKFRDAHLEPVLTEN